MEKATKSSRPVSQRNKLSQFALDFQGRSRLPPNNSKFKTQLGENKNDRSFESSDDFSNCEQEEITNQQDEKIHKNDSNSSSPEENKEIVDNLL